MLDNCCAFTGHRPHKFLWKYDEADSRCVALKAALAAQITRLVDAGVTDFYSDTIAIIGQITDVNDETDAYGSIVTIITFGIAELYDGVVPDVAPRDDEIFAGVLSGEGTGTWNIKIGSSTTLAELKAFLEEE